MAFQKILSIYNQLKKFGLDWREWSITEIKKDHVIQLKHRYDPDFQLEGRIRRSLDGRTAIQALRVISI